MKTDVEAVAVELAAEEPLEPTLGRADADALTQPLASVVPTATTHSRVAGPSSVTT